MIEAVREVGEQSLLRLQFGDHIERLVESEVSGVRIVAHGVQNQQVQIVELGHRVGRDEIDVGNIGGAATGSGIMEAKGLHRELAVHNGERSHSQPAQLKLRLQLMQRDARLAAASLCLDEDITIDAANIVEVLRRAIDRDFAVGQVVEAAQVVHAQNMVGMGMGNQHGVHAAKVGGECLQ